MSEDDDEEVTEVTVKVPNTKVTIKLDSFQV